MAEGVIIVPPDSTGKSLRTVTNPGVAAGAHQEVVTLADSAGTELGTNANPVPVSDAGGSLTVDGTFWQATQPVSGTVTADTELEAVAALADATANPTSSRLGSMSFLFNGTTWDRMRGDITNGLDVDVTRLPALVAGSAVIGHVITDTGSTTAVTGTVTVDSELEAVAAFADATANPTATRLGAYLFGYNGTTWDRLRSTTANGLAVDVTRVTGTVTVAGTVTANDVPNYTEDAASAADPVGFVGLAVRRDTPVITEVSADGDNIALKANSRGQLYVAGIDHDAVNLLETVQIGGHASGSDLPPALVSAAADRVHGWYDKAGAAVMRPRRNRNTWRATYRLAETTTALSLAKTTTANTTHQLATLHHAASATMDLRIDKITYFLTSTDIASAGIIEARYVTGTPATGNPVITPQKFHQGAAATEAVCLALPTTGGTDSTPNSPLASHAFNLAIQGAVNLSVGAEQTLYDATALTEDIPIVLRAGTLEGIAVVIRTVAAITVNAVISIQYSEELV